MTPNPIDELRRDLDQAFDRDPQGKGVAPILARYAANHDDWRDWTFFEGFYTRNLVHRSSRYELLLLGWSVGQESPIHDHAGQSCWMAVLDGVVEEVHYRQGADHAPLEEGDRRRFRPGQVAYIVDEIALHRVRPAPGGGGVSLHLYSDPIDVCRVYDPRTGESSPLEVGYHSVRGELCGGKTAEAVRAEWA